MELRSPENNEQDLLNDSENSREYNENSLEIVDDYQRLQELLKDGNSRFVTKLPFKNLPQTNDSVKKIQLSENFKKISKLREIIVESMQDETLSSSLNIQNEIIHEIVESLVYQGSEEVSELCELLVKKIKLNDYQHVLAKHFVEELYNSSSVDILSKIEILKALKNTYLEKEEISEYERLLIEYIEKNIENIDSKKEIGAKEESVTIHKELYSWLSESADGYKTLYYHNHLRELFNDNDFTLAVSGQIVDEFLPLDRNLQQSQNSPIDTIVILYFYRNISAKEVEYLLKLKESFDISWGYLYAKFKGIKNPSQEQIGVTPNQLQLDIAINEMLQKAGDIIRDAYNQDTAYWENGVTTRKGNSFDILRATSAKIFDKTFNLLEDVNLNQKNINNFNVQLAVFSSYTASFKEEKIIPDLESIEGTEITEMTGADLIKNLQITQRMKDIITQNYKNNPELQAEALRIFNSKLGNPDTEFVSIMYKGELAAFCRLESKDDGSRYWGSLNVDASSKGSDIGSIMLEYIMEKKHPDIVLRAHATAELPALSTYLKRGFIARSLARVGDNISMLEIVRDRTIMEYVSGAQKTTQKLASRTEIMDASRELFVNGYIITAINECEDGQMDVEYVHAPSITEA